MANIAAMFLSLHKADLSSGAPMAAPDESFADILAALTPQTAGEILPPAANDSAPLPALTQATARQAAIADLPNMLPRVATALQRAITLPGLLLHKATHPNTAKTAEATKPASAPRTTDASTPVSVNAPVTLVPKAFVAITPVDAGEIATDARPTPTASHLPIAPVAGGRPIPLDTTSPTSGNRAVVGEDTQLGVTPRGATLPSPTPPLPSRENATPRDDEAVADPAAQTTATQPAAMTPTPPRATATPSNASALPLRVVAEIVAAAKGDAQPTPLASDTKATIQPRIPASAPEVTSRNARPMIGAGPTAAPKTLTNAAAPIDKPAVTHTAAPTMATPKATTPPVSVTMTTPGRPLSAIVTGAPSANARPAGASEFLNVRALFDDAWSAAKTPSAATTVESRPAAPVAVTSRTATNTPELPVGPEIIATAKVAPQPVSAVAVSREPGNATAATVTPGHEPVAEVSNPVAPPETSEAASAPRSENDAPDVALEAFDATAPSVAVPRDPRSAAERAVTPRQEHVPEILNSVAPPKTSRAALAPLSSSDPSDVAPEIFDASAPSGFAVTAKAKAAASVPTNAPARPQSATVPAPEAKIISARDNPKPAPTVAVESRTAASAPNVSTRDVVTTNVLNLVAVPKVLPSTTGSAKPAASKPAAPAVTKAQASVPDNSAATASDVDQHAPTVFTREAGQGERPVTQQAHVAPAANPPAPSAEVAASAVRAAAPTIAGPTAANVASPTAPASANGVPQPHIGALAVAIAEKATSGAKHFDIRLDPPELGRVDVHLSLGDDGKAHASLVADKPQTLELLQRDSHTLQRALKDAGLELSNGNLSFSLKGQARQDDGGGASTPRARNAQVIARAEATNQSFSHTSIAPNSARLDIRV